MSTPSGQDPYFFAPTARMAPTSVIPVRDGHAATPPPSRHAAPKKSAGWLVPVAAAVVVVIAVVVGFVVLAHKDKHTEGNALLRPVQQADKVQLDSDLRLAATAEETWLAEHGSYTTDIAAAGYPSNGSVHVVVVSANVSTYCLRATKAATRAEYYSRAAGFSSAPCH